MAASFKSSFSRPKRLLKKNLQVRYGYPYRYRADCKRVDGPRAPRPTEPSRGGLSPDRAGPGPSQAKRAAACRACRPNSDPRRAEPHRTAPRRARPDRSLIRKGPVQAQAGPGPKPSRAEQVPALQPFFFTANCSGQRSSFHRQSMSLFFHGQAPPGGADNGKGTNLVQGSTSVVRS